MSDINSAYEDEIELIDIFRILWKWKLLIVIGTLAFGIGAIFYSLQLPKIYLTEMTIQPSILKVDNNGKRVYINSLKDITGRIAAGIYDDSVISKVWNGKDDDKPEKLKFNSNILTASNVLKISCKTQDVKEGIDILNYLFSFILKEENDLLTGVIDDYNDNIKLNNVAIEKSNTLIKSYGKNEKAIIKRIRDAHKDIEAMNANISYLSSERNNLLEKKGGTNGSLPALLYSNTIQQSIQFVNIVKKDINEYHRLKEVEVQKILRGKDEQKKVVQVNKNLEKERDGIVKMKILISPENSSNIPIKPNKKLIVLLSFVAGVFFCTFLAFFIEYLRNNTLTDK